MYARRHSYIDASKLRQSPLACRGVAVAVLVLSLGGCAGLGLPFGSELSASNASATGRLKPTLVSANVVDDVDTSDWETIRRTVAATAADTSVDRIPWNNPDTGSAGTIAGLSAEQVQSGLQCRTFATTINDQRGIRRYRGEACQRSNGRWQLFGMIADDAQLS
jgi:surface antigen